MQIIGSHLGNYLCHSRVIRIIVLDVQMRIIKQESWERRGDSEVLSLT